MSPISKGTPRHRTLVLPTTFSQKVQIGRKSYQKLNFAYSQRSRKVPGEVGVSIFCLSLLSKKSGACEDQLTSGSTWLVSSCSKALHFPTGDMLGSQLPKSKVTLLRHTQSKQWPHIRNYQSSHLFQHFASMLGFYQTCA